MTENSYSLSQTKTPGAELVSGAFLMPTIKLDKSLFDRYISYLDDSDSTIKTYSKALRVFYRWAEGKEISSPTRRDLMDYRDYLETYCKPTTERLYINALKQFYKWLDSEGITYDISRHLKPTRKGRVTLDFKKDSLTFGQSRELLDSIDRTTTEGLRNYCIVLLALSCGLRTIEINRADIGDLTTSQGYSVLWVQGKGHADKDRLVKVPEQTEKAIREYLSKRGSRAVEEPLFSSLSDRDKGERLSTDMISRIIKKNLRGIGLDSPRLTAHSLRHSFATLSLKSGSTLQEVSQALRHSSISTTMIYNHSNERANNQAEQRLTDRLFTEETQEAR